MKKFLIVLLLALVGTAVFASGENVVVLYNGRTQVNFEAMKYCQAYLRQASISMNVTSDPSTIKPGQYNAVVVLSTGYQSGLDPSLERFIKSYAAPNEIIVVSLQANSGQVFVNVARAAQSSYGVDAITSASTWPRGRGAQANQILSMHDKWLTDLVSLISGSHA